MYYPLILAACLPAVLGSAAPAPPDFKFDDLWSMQHHFLDNFLYPANVEQINATDNSVFAENVSPPRTKTPTKTHTKTSLHRSKAAST